MIEHTFKISPFVWFAIILHHIISQNFPIKEIKALKKEVVKRDNLIKFLASVIEVIANHVEFLEPKGSREIPNEEIVFDDEPTVEESKNLDSIDVTDDDLPF